MKLEYVLQVHTVLINKFGGSHGIRDMNGLDAALNRPFATFDGEDLYPTATDKAAAVFESILINHPFIDDNKRTGYVLMRIFLMQNGQDITASQDEKYQFVIEVTEGKHSIDTIKEWISMHLV